MKEFICNSTSLFNTLASESGRCHNKILTTLNMTRLTEIKAQIAELQKEADEVFKNDKRGAIADIISKMFAYNISTEELQKREKAPRSASTIKYRKSEFEIWGGRGPKPRWVKEVEEKGENLEVYRVQEEITQ